MNASFWVLFPLHVQLEQQSHGLHLIREEKSSHYDVCRANYTRRISKQTISWCLIGLDFCFLFVCVSVCLCPPRLWNAVPSCQSHFAPTPKKKPQQLLQSCTLRSVLIFEQQSSSSGVTRGGSKDTRSLRAAPTLPMEGWDENVHDSLFNVPTDFNSRATTPSSLLMERSNSVYSRITSGFNAATRSLVWLFFI